MEWLTIIGWIIWSICAVVTLGGIVTLRMRVRQGISHQWGTFVFSFLFAVMTVFFFFFEASKIHIVWILPLIFFGSSFVVLSGIPILAPFILFLTRMFLNMILLGVHPISDSTKGAGSHPDSKRIEDSNELWVAFHGKANSDEVLKAKATQFAKCIVDNANQSTILFFEEENGVSRKRVENDCRVCIEFCIFYLHYVDRIAFDFFYNELNKRKIFMDALVATTARLFSELWNIGESRKKELTQEFLQHYASIISEYARYKKVTADKEEPLGGTLFWEAEKRICEAESAGKKEVGAFEVMQVHAILCPSIAELQIEKLLQGK